MEKLFRRNGIDTYSISCGIDDLAGFLAYTRKLLELNMLIEVTGDFSSGRVDTQQKIALHLKYRVGEVIHVYELFVFEHNTAALPVYRIVSDAIDFIEHCDPDDLVEELKVIAVSYSICSPDHVLIEEHENELELWDLYMGEIQNC